MQKSIDRKLFAHIATGFSLQGSYHLEGMYQLITIDYLARYLMVCDKSSFSISEMHSVDELQKAFNGLLKYAGMMDALGQVPETRDLNMVSESIAQDVQNLDDNMRLLIPGGWFRHAVVYEFKRKGDGLLFSIYNSGRGIEYHEHRAGKTQQHFSPTLTYLIPDLYTYTPHMTNGLALSLYIKSLITAYCCKTDYYATRMYQEVYPEIVHLGGEIVSAVDRIPEHAWQIEQLSGVCTQEVLYRVLQLGFVSFDNYERFVFGFKQYALKDYWDVLTQNKQLNEPAVRHQLSMAIEDLLRILNQASIFSEDEIRRESAVLLEYQQQLSLPLVRLPVEQPAIAIVTSTNFDVKSSKTLSVGGISKALSRSGIVWEDPIFVKLDNQLLDDIERVVQRCDRLSKAGRYQEVIEQIEILFTSLPLPSCIGQSVDAYAVIDSLSKAVYVSRFVAKLQENYMTACQQLYAGAQVPSMLVIQLSLLAVLDYVNTTRPISGEAVNSLMRSDISRLLAYHMNDPYLITNRPALDSRLHALKQLYGQNIPEFDDAKYLAYYSAIIDTNQTAKKWLKNEYSKIEWAHARKPAALQIHAIEELYYFVKYVMNRSTLSLPFEVTDSVIKLKSRFRHELELEGCFVNVLRLFSGETFPVNPSTEIKIGFYKLSEEQVKIRIQSPSKDNAYRVANKELLRTKYNITPNSIYHYALTGDHEVVEHQWTKTKPFDNGLLLVPLTATHEALYETNYISISPKPVGLADIEARELFQLRSVPELQLALTMNYVARHMDKWTNKDFRLYVEANITERLSVDITPNNSVLKTLDGLVRRFTYQCRLKAEAIDLIRLSYLVACAVDYSRSSEISRLSMCQEMIASIMATPQDEEILASLHRYQFLTLMAQVELGSPFDEALPRLLQSYFFMQAKQSSEELDRATIAELNVVMLVFKRRVSRSRSLNCQMVKDATQPVLGRLLANYEVSGRYPIFSAKSSDKQTYTLDVERGLISSGPWVLLPIPLDILQHPFLNDVDFSGQSTCKQSIDGLITTIDIPSKGCFRFIANPNQTEPKYSLQKKWGEDWYELQHLSDAQKNALGFQTLAVDIEGLPDSLMDRSSEAWVCCDDAKRVLLTQDNVPSFLYLPKSRKFKQLRDGLDNSPMEMVSRPSVVPDFFLCDSRNDGIASLFSHVEDPAFLVVTTNGSLLSIDFTRYGMKLVGHLLGSGQWEFNSADGRYVLLLGQSPVASGVAGLVFASVDNPTQKRCVLMVQPFINTSRPSQTDEYYQLQQDVSGNVQTSLIGEGAHPLWQYSLSERFIELPMKDGEPFVDTARDALFLAYVYLGVGQHEKAWAVLEDCATRIGGLEGTYDELVFLQWIVDELPFQLKEEDEEAVRLSQEDVAIKLKALALLTAYHRLGRIIAMPQRPMRIDTDNDVVAQKRQERVNTFYNELPDRIELHYTRYQNLAFHASAPFYLNDREQKSLLGACSSKYGAMAYQSEALNAAAIKQERARLIERQNFGPLDKYDSMRLKAIDGLLGKNLPIIGHQTTLTEKWLNIHLKQPPRLADEVLNVPATTDEGTLQNAVDALSPYMTDQEFFQLLPSYYELACCHEPVVLHKQLVDFCANTIQATYRMPDDRHRKFMTYICYALYVIATTKPSMSQDEWRQIPKHTLYGLMQLAYGRESPGIKTREFDDSSAILTDNLWAELPEPLERIPLVLESHSTLSIASMDDFITIISELSEFYSEFQSETVKLQEDLDRLSNPPVGRVLSVEENEAGLLRYQSLQSLKKLAKASPLSDLKVQKNMAKRIKPYMLKLTETCDNQQVVLLKLANQGPSDKESALRWQLDIASRTRLPLDLNAALLLYFKSDVALYRQETGLNDEDIAKLHLLISEFVATSTHLQQVQRVYDKLQKVIDMLDGDAKDAVIFQLAQTLCERNQIDTLQETTLALIQYHSNFILRPRQIKALASLLAPPDEKNPYSFQEVIEELLPGQGKTEVIAPAIAQQKANGLNLVVIETIPALLNKTHANLNQVSQTRFRQTAHRFEFNREDDCSSVRLESIYAMLVEIQLQRDYLVTTGDSMQALELNYFELLYSRPSAESGLLYEWSRQVNAAESIIKLLLERADVLMDEVHLVLWIKKRLNYALGGQQSIPKQLINDCVTLYQFLGQMTVIVDGVRCSFIEAITQSSFISQELFQAQVMCLAESTGPLSRLMSGFSSEEQQEISAYLKNEGSTIPLCITNTSKATQDTLEVYKLQLNQLLAQTSRRRLNVHYGPSRLASIDAMTRAVAIPYSANNQPNEGSQFEQVLESINYTIQSLLISGLTDEMVRDFLCMLQADALQQVQQSSDSSMTLDDTWAALAYKEMTKELVKLPVFSAINLDNEVQCREIAEVLRHNQAFIYDVLKRCILPKIMIDKKVLHSNAYHHVDMVHSCQGITGTAGNSATYHQRIQFNPKTNAGNTAFVVRLLKEKQPGIVIRGIDFQETTSFIKQLFKDLSAPVCARAIIDISATFQGIENHVVAAALADYIHENTERWVPSLRYVLFYNEHNMLCAYNIMSRTVQELSSTKETADIDRQLGCTVDERMTFYDNLHAIGENIAQADAATGIVLVDDQTTLDAFVQGVMRMRGLQDRQSIELVVPSKLANKTLDEIILNMASVQQQALSQELYEAACDKMTNVLRNDLKRRLLSTESLDEKCRLAAAFQGFFIETPSLDWFKTHGGLHRAQETKTLLERHQAQQLEKWRQVMTIALNVGQRPLFDVEYEALKQQMLSIMNDALIVCEKTYIANMASLGTQVETMKEQFKQHQTAGLLPASIHEMHYQILFQEDLMVAYKLLPHVKLLRALYDDLTGLKDYEIPQFSDNLYVSQNFYQCYQGQTEFIGRYQKPVLVLFFRLHDDGNLDCLLVSQQDAGLLQSLVERSSQKVWLSDTNHTVLKGARPEGVLHDKRYYDLITQVRFYNGELGGLLDEPGAMTWLQEKTPEKIAFFKRCVLPYRDVREDAIEQLRQSLSETLEVYRDIADKAPNCALTDINWRTAYPEQQFTEDDIAQLTALAQAITDANVYWYDNEWLSLDKQTRYSLQPRALGVLVYYVDELQQLRELLHVLEAYDDVKGPLSRVFINEKYQHLLCRFTGEELDFSSQEHLNENCLHALTTLSELPFLQKDIRWQAVVKKCKSSADYMLPAIDSAQSLSNILKSGKARDQETKLGVDVSNGLGIKKAVVQLGHECKTTAIATIESFYASKVGYEAIPLRKDGARHVISIRELAKKHGSVQGELLEVRQLGNIFDDIGIDTELLDFTDNITMFKQQIQQCIAEGNVPIVFFTVSRDTGLPTIEGAPEEREHAAIINDYSPETDALEIIHWGAIYQTTAKDLFDSSAILPMTRQPEFYEAVDVSLRIDSDRKYEKRNRDKSRSAQPIIKQSIVPQQNTGFRCKMLIVKRPTLEKIQKARKETVPKSLNVKLQQSLMGLEIYLNKAKINHPDDKILAFVSQLVTRVSYRQMRFLQMESIQLDRIVRVIKSTHRVVQCYVEQTSILPMAMSDLDKALQKIISGREAKILPQQYWSLLGDEDVYRLFLELTCLLEHSQISRHDFVRLENQTLEKGQLFEVIQKVIDIEDALLVSIPLIEHPEVDLDICIALMDNSYFSSIFSQKEGSLQCFEFAYSDDQGLMDVRKRLFANKIQSLLGQENITAEQLSSIRCNPESYLGKDTTAWLHFLRHLAQHKIKDSLLGARTLLQNSDMSLELTSDALIYLVRLLNFILDKDSLFVIESILKHPKTDLSVLIAIHELILENYTNDEDLKKFSDTRIFIEIVKLFKKKLLTSADNSLVSTEQLLNVLKNFKLVLKGGEERQILLSRLLSHPNMNQQVFDSLIKDMKYEDAAFAIALLESPFMSTNCVKEVVAKVSIDELYALYNNAIWDTHVELRAAFLSSNSVRCSVLDGILRLDDDKSRYNELKRLCEFMQPNRDYMIYKSFLTSGDNQKDDETWLLSITDPNDGILQNVIRKLHQEEMRSRVNSARDESAESQLSRNKSA